MCSGGLDDETDFLVSHSYCVLMQMVPATTSIVAIMVRRDIASNGIQATMKDERRVEIETRIEEHRQGVQRTSQATGIKESRERRRDDLRVGHT